jgi:hypothetical protein
MKVWTQENKELLEDFFSQDSQQYPINECAPPQEKALCIFSKGRLTLEECDELLQMHYSDLSGECDREGFCE